MSLLALLLFVAADPQSAGSADYLQADKYFAANRLPDALGALERALKAEPKLIPALNLYARIALIMNRPDEARNSLERALEVDPKSTASRFLYGLSFYLENDVAAALPHFELARKGNPQDARAALYAGLAYESLGRTSEALAAYDDSARLSPESDTFLAAARLLALQEQFEESERRLHQALDLSPRSRDAHFELARMRLRQGRQKEAAEEAERALALPGGIVKDAQIHYLLVRAYRGIDPARAQQHAEDAGRP